MAKLEIKTTKTIWYYAFLLCCILPVTLRFLGTKTIMKIGIKTTIKINFKTMEIY